MGVYYSFIHFLFIRRVLICSLSVSVNTLLFCQLRVKNNSLLLYSLADTIDLLNVSFDSQLAPDRVSARIGLGELQKIAPHRR